MLPKHNRIVTDQSIKKVYQSKFRFRTKYYNLISRKQFDQTDYKILVVISKKIFKKACLRNKVKRRIHSICQTQNINKQFNLLFQIQNPEILRLEFVDLSKLIVDSLKPFVVKQVDQNLQK